MSMLFFLQKKFKSKLIQKNIANSVLHKYTDASLESNKKKKKT